MESKNLKNKLRNWPKNKGPGTNQNKRDQELAQNKKNKNWPEQK